MLGNMQNKNSLSRIDKRIATDEATPDLTIRQSIIEILKGRMLSARDISREANIKEKDVLEHLPHIARTITGSRNKFEKKRFVVEPSRCLSCGFVFKKRDRLKTPSKCPSCRSEEITETRFGIAEG